MRFQCRYIDASGKRCENEAIKRIHFAEDHPFDHTDCCEVHIEEYPIFAWIQDLYFRETINANNPS
jgi:hypothetical protein